MSDTTPDQKGAEPGRLFNAMDADDEARNIFSELDELSKTASRDMGVDVVMISVVQGEYLHTLGSFPAMEDDMGARRHNPPDTVCMRTIEREGVLKVEDATKDSALQKCGSTLQGPLV